MIDEWKSRLLAAAIIGIVGLSQIPPNVLLGAESPMREPVGSVLPQGWAFFTRDPRTPIMTPLGAKPSELEHSARRFLPFDRSVRTIEGELTIVGGEAVWSECPVSVSSCDDALVSRQALVNNHVGRRLCGAMVLTRREPVPFAWRNLIEPDECLVRQLPWTSRVDRDRAIAARVGGRATLWPS